MPKGPYEIVRDPKYETQSELGIFAWNLSPEKVGTNSIGTCKNFGSCLGSNSITTLKIGFSRVPWPEYDLNLELFLEFRTVAKSDRIRLRLGKTL